MSVLGARTWYIVFIKTGMEDTLCKFFKSNQMDCFAPKKEVVYRHAGESKIQVITLFPGYLFFPSDLAPLQFHLELQKLKGQKTGIIKELKYSDEDTSALLPQEQELLEAMLNKKKVLAASKGLIENDQVLITEGPLKGQESRIIHIDRHKRQADIAMSLCGRDIRVKVALEIVKKI
jgi:transcriptional antiterminator NusG